MRGRVCLVTGGSGGIGLATAKALKAQGATVHIVGRNREKLARAARELDSVSFRADFASLASVRELASALLARDEPLHVLINNAGIWLPDFQTTEDGFEQTFAVNHLAPYLLTRLLLPRLRESGGDPRVVHVSSRLHLQAGQTGTPVGRAIHLLNVIGLRVGGAQARFEWDRLDRREGFRGLEAYARSKLAQILFSNELARRQTDVSSNAVHPGSVATDVTRESAVLRLLEPLSRRILKTPAQGARTSVYVASDPSLRGVSGRYFANAKRATPASVVHDEALGRELWELSAERVGL